VPKVHHKNGENIKQIVKNMSAATVVVKIIVSRKRKEEPLRPKTQVGASAADSASVDAAVDRPNRSHVLSGASKWRARARDLRLVR